MLTWHVEQHCADARNKYMSHAIAVSMLQACRQLRTPRRVQEEVQGSQGQLQGSQTPRNPPVPRVPSQQQVSVRFWVCGCRQ
jgi:hypothetical protein